MWDVRNPTVRNIVIERLACYAAQVCSHLTESEQNRSDEDYEAALRSLRTFRSATSLLGSFCLNRVTGLLGELLESRRECQPQVDAELSEHAEEMLAVTLQQANEEFCGEANGQPNSESTNQLMDAVLKTRRMLNLPEAEDEVAINAIFSVPSSFCQSPHESCESDGEPASEADASSEASGDVPEELRLIFQEEAAEHLEKIYQALKDLHGDLQNRDLVQQVRRSAHTLKGAAGAVGMRDATKLAHRMEDYLDRLFDGDDALSDASHQLLTRTTDLLHDLTTGEASDRLAGMEEIYAGYDQLCGTTKPAQQGSPPAPRKNRVSQPAKSESKQTTTPSFTRVPTHRLDALRQTVGELVVNRSGVTQNIEQMDQSISDLASVLDMFSDLSREIENARLQSNTPVAANVDGRPGNEWLAEFDELEFDRFSQLDLWSHSITEVSSALQTIRRDMHTLADSCRSLLIRQDRLTLATQSQILKIQMVPAQTIVPRLERTLREVAHSQQKNVDLVVEGSNVELDKNVLEQLVEPLLHLIRNAVDHGFEANPERSQTEKPATATLRISFSHFGTQVIIRVSDDGRGLNQEAIKKAAIERGIVGREQAEAFTEQDLYRCILRPGFSTASSVSEISGRGVGMDVVQAKVEELQGRIDIESQPGAGTTFKVRIPVSLSTTRVLMLTIGSEVVAIPQSFVHCVEQFEPRAIRRNDGTEQIDFEQAEIPLVRLQDYLGIDGATRPNSGLVLCVILGTAGQQVALEIDGVLPGRDVVVQPVPSQLGAQACLLGATIAADGNIVPVLDPSDFVEQEVGSSGDLEAVCPLRVMMVDDSLSVRSVIENVVTQAGWKAIPASDGVDALELLASLDSSPDVFLLDVEMPRMDGFELLKHLRQEPAFSAIPVIMITSRSGEKHRQQAIELGATDYLTKPFQPEQLLDAIGRHVKQAGR